jgi:lipoprotein NlpD
VLVGLEGEIRMNVWMSGRYARTALAMAGLCLLAACGTATVVSRTGSSTASAPARSIAKPGQTVTIRKGDTVYALARIHSITPADLIAWNRLSNPSTIYPGQVLKLYPSSASTASSTAVTRPPAASGGTTRAPATVVSVPAPAASAPASTGISWRWPADGVLVGRFVNGDTTKQGVDIAGTSGQDVRAAAAGTVVYSGAGLVGYGELIIIKHNDQWLSAYGHNRKRLVSEGQAVRSGDKIAEMGRTSAARDMLHFEVRYNGKPVDPLLYLPAK